MSALDRYLAREILPPFAAGLVFLTQVLVATQLLGQAEVLLGSDVSGLDLAVVVASLTPHFLGYVLPVAFLLGGVLGVGRLTEDVPWSYAHSFRKRRRISSAPMAPVRSTAASCVASSKCRPINMEYGPCLSALVEMSMLFGRKRFERASLPAPSQLDLHVDSKTLLGLVMEDMDAEDLSQIDRPKDHDAN